MTRPEPATPSPLRESRQFAWLRTISARIVLLFAGLFLLILLAIQLVGLYGLPFLGLDGWIRQLSQDEFRKLSAAAEASKSGVESWIRDRRDDLLVVSRQRGVAEHLSAFARRPSPFDASQAQRNAERYGVAQQLALIHDTYGAYDSIALIEPHGGRIVAGSDATKVGNVLLDGEELATVTASGFEESLSISPGDQNARPLLRIFRQVVDADDHLLGLMVFSIDLENELRTRLDSMLAELRGSSGEVLLYDAQGRFVLQPRHALADGRRPAPLLDSDPSRIAELAVRGGEGQIAATDYRGEPVLAAYRHIRLSPEIGWGLVVKKDEREVLATLREHNRTVVLLALAGLLAFLGTAILSARWITRPIRAVIAAARQIETGQWSARATVRGDTEIADLAQTFNAMARRIGEWHEALDARVSQQTARILEQEGTLVAFTQTTNDAIITIDEGGRITGWNPAAEVLFGYAENEALGLDLHALVAPEAYRAEADAGLRHYVETGSGPLFNTLRDLPAVTRSGKLITVELTVSPITVGGKRHAIGTLRDISERKRIEKAMRVLGERLAMSVGEDYFKSLAAALADAVGADYVLVGELLPGEPLRVATVGFVTPEGIAENVEYALPGTPCDSVAGGHYCIYADGVQQRFPEDHLLVDMAVSAYAGQPLVDKSGKPIGLIAAQWRQPLADRAAPETMLRLFASRAGAELERMQAQRELSRTLENLEAMVAARTHDLTRSNSELAKTVGVLTEARRELVEAEKLASLGRLVAGVAHELNTPIGNSVMVSTALSEKIRLFRDAVQGGSVKRSTLTEFTDDLDQAARLLASALGQAAELIHGFKQVAVDQTSSQRRRFDLRTVVEEIVVTLHPRLKKTSHQVVIDIPEGIALDSYPGPLGQIITNLVDNSLTHAFENREHGSIRIAARLPDRDFIEMSFVDDGCGMEAKVRERVFDPFFTTRMGRGGSGLGMNIVYNIVTGILGGRIAVQSAPGSGTTYQLTLPRKAPNQPATTEKP